MAFAASSLPSRQIGDNIARLRRRRGLTLDGLAEISLVSRAAISTLEQGGGNPRLQTIWNLADALNVQFSQLLGDNGREPVTDENGISVRLLERQSVPQMVEAFLLELPPQASRHAKPHVSGVREHVVVLAGELKVGPEAAPSLLRCGQASHFAADVPHLYATGNEPCRAMVTVIYPEFGSAASAPDHDLPWPRSHAEWQAAEGILTRAAIDVQNGLDACRTTFRAARRESSNARVVLMERVAKLPVSPAIRRYVCVRTSPTVVTLYRTLPLGSLGKQTKTTGTDLVKRCWVLAERAQQQCTDREIVSLAARAAGPGAIIEAALAAEVLTCNGRPTVPFGVGSPQVSGSVGHGNEAGRRFEERIDVDAYGAFELVHPAYARQTLAVAAALPHLPETPAFNILDVGTGPGLPLLMLKELRPDIRAVAVDSSPAAVSHLRERFKGDPAITIRLSSITDLDPPAEPFPCTVSIGASHHLDTAAFLSAIRRQMTQGGYLIVADEMIAPFASRDERQCRLIRHHLWYIMDTLVTLPLQKADTAEIKLAAILKEVLPLASAFAHGGDATMASRMVREVFEEVNELPLPREISHPLAAFSRFHLLELQALVAGLDYEVEQKTTPSRFIALAASCGFVLQRHQRIYATDGDCPYDAGTHLFVMEAV